MLYAVNGANPFVGSESLAQNIDHFYTVTEYSLEQLMTLGGFTRIQPFPLKLYVFYRNPFNYLGLFVTTLLEAVAANRVPALWQEGIDPVEEDRRRRVPGLSGRDESGRGIQRMRIGIMLRHVGQHPGGVVVYTNELLRALFGLGSGHEFVLFFQQSPPPDLFPETAGVRHVVVPTASRLLWDQVALPLAVRRERIDVLFNPKYSIPLAVTCRTAWVCHGLDWYVMPWASRLPDRISHRVLVPQYVRKADAIITVSATVRDHALQYLNVRPQKLHVVYSGAHERFRRPVTAAAQQALRTRLESPGAVRHFCRRVVPAEEFHSPAAGVCGKRARSRVSPGRRGWHREIPGGTRNRAEHQPGLAGLGSQRRLAGAGGPAHPVLDGHWHVDAFAVRSLPVADHRSHGRRLPHRDGQPLWHGGAGR